MENDRPNQLDCRSALVTPLRCETPIKMRNDPCLIEATSSPEIACSSNISQKRRIIRNTRRRSKSKRESGKCGSTPLTGLISRKAVSSSVRNVDSRLSLFKNDERSSVKSTFVSLPIDSFDSPKKHFDVKRHSQMNTPDASFISKYPLKVVKHSPLLRVVEKNPFLNPRLSNSSVKDHLTVTDLETVEHFESPMKPTNSLRDREWINRNEMNIKERYESLKSTSIRDHLTVTDLATHATLETVEHFESPMKPTNSLSDREWINQNEMNIKEGNSMKNMSISEVAGEPGDSSGSKLVSRSSPLRSPILFVKNYSTDECTQLISDVSPTSRNERDFPESDSKLSTGYDVQNDLVSCNIEQTQSPLIEESSIGVDNLEADLYSEMTISGQITSENRCINRFPSPLKTNDFHMEPEFESHIDECQEKVYFDVDLTKADIVASESPSKATVDSFVAERINEFQSQNCYRSKDTTALDVCDNSHRRSADYEISGEAPAEEITSRKRRKKSGLIERARAVISRLEATRSLFEYEVSMGLLAPVGKHISSPLVVCKLCGSPKSSLIFCIPLKHHLRPAPQYAHVHRSLLVAIVVEQPNYEISEGSVVLLYYPLTVISSSLLGIPHFLAGNQMVLQSSTNLHRKTPNIDKLIVSHNSFCEYFPLNSSNSIKLFSSKSVVSLIEAAACQNLVDSSILYLTVLHTAKISCQKNGPKLVALCSDKSNYCWLEFTLERDMRKAAALELSRILFDGFQIQIQAFHVVKTSFINQITKNLLEYCSNCPVNGNIFTLTPIRPTWTVKSLGESANVTKTRALVERIKLDDTPGKRYMFEVHEVTRDQDVVHLKDSEDHKIPYVHEEIALDVRIDSFATPFVLDAVYYCDGKLFSDCFTRFPC